MSNSKKDYDFSGWATKNNIRCSDGRTILKDAFKINDGQKVPLVWNHQHNDPSEVLGHALLENREEGVYAYGKFNNTEAGQVAKELVANGDIDKLSIYANKLQTHQNNVMHGCIREVSIVIAGANPGAFIDTVMKHSDSSEEEAIIYTGEQIEFLEHSDNEEKEETDAMDKENENKEVKNEVKNEDKKEKSVEDIFNTLTEEQKEAVYAIIGTIADDIKHSDEDSEDEKSEENDKDESEDTESNKEETDESEESEEESEENTDNKDNEEEDQMKHNAFNRNGENNNEELQHSEILASAIKDAKKYGSLRDSVIQHAAINNITDIGKLFPEATALNREPIMIEKDQTWVGKVIDGARHTPFSRVKATFGRMTEPQARAKGYIKGNKKTNIQMAALNRITSPTTVYIKNEIDRDDVIDITDFDVVAWQKKEMRKELNKELALAALIGDGRDVSDQDKINEANIIPIAKDVDTFTIKYTVTEGRDYKQTGNSYSENDSVTKGIIRAALRARKEYKGSGKPTFFTTEDILTDMLLIEDQNGRRIYNNEKDLAIALRCDEIVTVPEMEQEAYADYIGIIVNMADYTFGADKGGNVNMFDDFDIDYNQMKYLMETRCSGALTVPYSAILLKKASSGNNTADPEPEG